MYPLLNIEGLGRCEKYDAEPNAKKNSVMIHCDNLLILTYGL
jgi:hypothetical protein